LDATNVKALLRRAKAHTMRHEYQKAMGDLERVKDIEPWNEEAEHELQRLKQVMQKGREEQKRLYANMFQH
jgi:hypothetical protein